MKRTILIADDEPYIVESLTFLFEHQGYHVESAGDGRTALEMLNTLKPDVIVLDAMMRHYTGFDVLKLMRADARYAQVKVLMLTAKGGTLTNSWRWNSAQTVYIAKPYANKDVIAAVSELLEGDD